MPRLTRYENWFISVELKVKRLIIVHLHTLKTVHMFTFIISSISPPVAAWYYSCVTKQVTRLLLFTERRYSERILVCRKMSKLWYPHFIVTRVYVGLLLSIWMLIICTRVLLCGKWSFAVVNFQAAQAYHNAGKYRPGRELYSTMLESIKK